MPEPGFLTSLSQGIFGRLGELQQQQDTQDREQKGQVLDMLTSLAPHVDPQSYPAYMKLVGDTIGIRKSGLKDFWSALSGYPDRSVQQQLGETVRQASQQFMSPGEAKAVRDQANLARTFAPQTPQQQTNQANVLQAEQDLKNRIVFRNPLEEQKQLLEEKYGALYAGKMNLLRQQDEFREQQLRERELNRGLQQTFAFQQRERLAKEGLSGNIAKMYGSLGANPTVSQELGEAWS